MNFTVPESVLKETTKCPRNFSCLETGKPGDPDKCKVRYSDGKNVLFLFSQEATECPYRLLFGTMAICRCPTHFALVTEYDEGEPHRKPTRAGEDG